MMDEAETLSPLVSVCIPTYNNASMVGDAIRSARAQSFSDLEILVLDNHSTDTTPLSIDAAREEDSRVRVVRHAKNRGMAGNFNAAIRMARGDLTLILCADDVLDPTCIEILVRELTHAPGCVLAACGRTMVDEGLAPRSVKRSRSRREVVRGRDLIVECFANGNVIGEPSAVMFRRSAAKAPFNESYCQLLDLDMWFRLLAQGDAILLPDPLCRIRRHAHQWSTANVRSGRVLSDKQAFFREYAGPLVKDLGLLQKLRWDVRMASTLASISPASNLAPSRELNEIFFASLFSSIRFLVGTAHAIQSYFR